MGDWPLPPSGVTYSELYLWREAARWAGYPRYRDFMAEAGDEQACVVAHFTSHHQLEAVKAEDQRRKDRRRRLLRGNLRQ